MKFSGAISVILLSCAVVTSNAQQDKSRFLRKQEEAGSILEKVYGADGVVRHLVQEEAEESKADAEDESEEEEETNAYGSWSTSRWDSYQDQKNGDGNNYDGQQQHATSWSSSAHYSRNVAAAAAMTVAGVFLANRLKVKCSSCKRASRNISLIEDDASNTAAYTLA